MSIIVTVPRRLSYSDRVLNANPIGYWRLGESTGATAFDETGNHNGTYINTPTLGVSGLINSNNTAVDFIKANNEYVSLPALSGITNEISIEAWTEADNTSDYMRVIVLNAQSPFIILSLNAGSANVIEFVVRGTSGNVMITTSSFDVTQIHHIVGTAISNGTMKLYVDGAEVGSDTVTTFEQLDFPGEKNNNIGASRDVNPNRMFDGTIDEVAVYNSILTPTQIQRHYNVGIGV